MVDVNGLWFHGVILLGLAFDGRHGSLSGSACLWLKWVRMVLLVGCNIASQKLLLPKVASEVIGDNDVYL